MEPLDGLKERMKFFTTIFQVGATMWLGISVSIISYIGKKNDFLIKRQEINLLHDKWLTDPYPNPDVFLFIQVLVWFFCLITSLIFLVRVDQINDDIFETEKINQLTKK